MLNREYAVIAVLMILVCILAAANIASSDDDGLVRPAATRSLGRAPRAPRRGGGGGAPPAGGGAPPAGGGAPPAGGGAPAPAAPAAPILATNPGVVIVPPTPPHPGDPGANALLLGAGNNAIGHEARVVAVTDNHFDLLAAGERRRAQAWEDVTTGRVRSWRGLAIFAIVFGLIVAFVLTVLVVKSIYEPTTASATTAPATVAAPSSTFSGPTSIVIASPAPTSVNAGKTVTCGSATNPCPQAVDICQRQGSESDIRTCCSQIGDSSQREMCMAVTNSRLALR